MLTGKIGTILFPLRSLPQHIAAICPVPDYWDLLESRSRKISESVTQTTAKERGRGYDRGRQHQVFVPGQQVAVRTEVCLSYLFVVVFHYN